MPATVILTAENLGVGFKSRHCYFQHYKCSSIMISAKQSQGVSGRKTTKGLEQMSGGRVGGFPLNWIPSDQTPKH